MAEFLRHPVYDMNGDLYMSEKHKWRIYLSKRVKKKEENMEDPREIIQAAETYMKKSPLYCYNRKKPKTHKSSGQLMSSSKNSNHLTRFGTRPPPV